tara:strand:+ start:708 stop:866 length:159 start_codon:yes stop_codon:yes gene_type:complete
LAGATYCACLAARADMKTKYEQLVSTGKCKKLAFAAVMHQLIVMANALLRDG